MPVKWDYLRCFLLLNIFFVVNLNEVWLYSAHCVLMFPKAARRLVQLGLNLLGLLISNNFLKSLYQTTSTLISIEGIWRLFFWLTILVRTVLLQWYLAGLSRLRTLHGSLAWEYLNFSWDTSIFFCDKFLIKRSRVLFFITFIIAF